MFSFQQLIIIIAVMWLFSAVLMEFFQDIAYLIVSGFSEDARTKIVTDIGALVSLGQTRVKDGVLGMKELKDEGCINTNTTIKCPLTELQVKGLANSYRDMIIKGTAVSLIYIVIIYLVINKGNEAVTGFTIPFLWAVVISILITGIIAWVFMGFKGYPFEGWILLIQNYWIWTSTTINVVSPVPLNDSIKI